YLPEPLIDAQAWEEEVSASHEGAAMPEGSSEPAQREESPAALNEGEAPAVPEAASPSEILPGGLAPVKPLTAPHRAPTNSSAMPIVEEEDDEVMGEAIPRRRRRRENVNIADVVK